MSITGLCKRVASLGHTMLERGYLLDTQAHAVSNLSSTLKALSWVSDGAGTAMTPALPKVDDYLNVIRDREYSYLMRDGSVIRIQYRFLGSDVIKHRLLFWPCPFAFSEEVFALDEPILDVIEGLKMDNLREEAILVGLLRFDYDPGASSSDHPASHLTLARSSCRIPVHAPVAFDTFMKFILENFYGDVWADESVRSHFSFNQEVSCLQKEESQRVHLAWHYT